MLFVAISTVSDGSMKSSDGSYASVLPARTNFLKQHDIQPENTTLVHLTYEGDNYTRYRVAAETDKGDGIIRSPSYIADGMVVTERDHALFLPLADCIGAVIHDPTKDILMLTHLGRHNLEQFGGTKSVEYLIERFGCDPKVLTVWLSPAAGQENYPLYVFDNRGMHDVAIEQLISAGVSVENITASPVDVTKDNGYFSHSEFLKGHRSTDGRFAVGAVMRS
jgi:copper oxidase (laccase) domain-containing protein